MKPRDVKMVTVNGTDLILTFSRSQPLGATVRADIEASGEYVEAEMFVSNDGKILDAPTAAAMLRALAHEIEIGAL